MSLCTKFLGTVFRRHSKRNHTSLHHRHTFLLAANWCLPFPFSLQEKELQKQLSLKSTMIPVQNKYQRSPPPSTRKKPPFVEHSRCCQLRSAQRTHDVFKLTRTALNCTHYLLVPHHKIPFPTIRPTKFSLSHCITTRFTSLCCSSSPRKADWVRTCRAKKHLRQDRSVVPGTPHAVTEAVFGRVHQHARNPAELSEDFPFKPH